MIFSENRYPLFGIMRYRERGGVGGDRRHVAAERRHRVAVRAPMSGTATTKPRATTNEYRLPAIYYLPLAAVFQELKRSEQPRVFASYATMREGPHSQVSIQAVQHRR